ncbi:MAG: type 11 methyltransferase [Acidimicrobiales bacterium]|nr:type 11 methyltransferase [Acidimicrobiales bacterium]
MTDAWEHAYAERAASFRHWPNEELIRFLGRQPHLRKQADGRAGRVLELGCGNGANLWAVAADGVAGFGVDVSLSALRLARATFQHRAVDPPVLIGDARCLPYADETFEAVFDVVSLQHIPFSDLGRAYAEARRVLRPGGWFFTCHMGAATWDHDHGGGRLVGYHTFDEMGPEALFPHLGTISLPAPEDLRDLLRASRFEEPTIEDVIKSYDGRTRHVQYIIGTTRRC